MKQVSCLKYYLAVLIFAGLAIFYFFLDPVRFRFIPKCMFHELTGWECPGCGSQRMLHSLLHGNIADAWHHNALFVVLIPILIPMVYLELRKQKYPKAYAMVNSLPVIMVIGGAIVIWGVVRNLI